MAAPNMLALVAWLKSFQYLGYFPGLEEVPEPVLAHMRSALGLSEPAALLRICRFVRGDFREVTEPNPWRRARAASYGGARP